MAVTEREVQNIKWVGSKMEYEFYNPSQKERFINQRKEEITMSDGMLERIFTRTRQFEEENNKDVSEFTVNEISDMYKRLNFSSLDNIMNFNVQLKIYSNWCLGQAYIEDCINHYAEIQKMQNLLIYVDNVAANRRIITRQELVAKSSLLGNACDRFALLAIFEGINGKDRKELINIRTTDFNDDDTVNIVREDRVTKERRIVKVKVSGLLKELAFESAEMDHYQVATTTARNFLLRDDPTLIIKHFMAAKEDTSDTFKGRRLFFRLSKCLDSLDIVGITINSISDSGKIHMINEIAKREGLSGKDVLFTPKLLNEVNEQFGCSISRSIFIKKYDKYLIEEIEETKE